MNREIRELVFTEGLNTTAPDQRFIDAGGLVPFSSSTAYVTAKGTGAEVGDLFYNTTSNHINEYNGSWREITEIDSSQTLTNKVIDGDDNTLRDIGLSSLKVDASATNVFIQRDNTGNVTNTKQVPSGVVVGTSDAQTLTNKTISGSSNTLSNINISSLLIDAANTNIFIKRDNSGNVTNGPAIPAGSIVGTSASQTLTNKTISGANNTLSSISNTSLLVDSSSTNVFLHRDGTGNVVNTKQVPGGLVVGSNDTMVLTNKQFDDAIYIKQLTTPGNPASGYNKLYTKSDDNLYRLKSDGTETAVGGAAGTVYIAHIQDVKAANTDSGSFNSGAWRTRDLNTLTGDTAFISVSSNQFILNAGTYSVWFAAPAYSTNEMKAKIRNITAGTDALIGESSFSNAGSGQSIDALVSGRLTPAITTTYELQHYATTTRGTNGFGVKMNVAVSEVYAHGIIIKLA
jgi:hypothetical protein